jgi:hypothetical protein
MLSFTYSFPALLALGFCIKKGAMLPEESFDEPLRNTPGLRAECKDGQEATWRTGTLTLLIWYISWARMPRSKDSSLHLTELVSQPVGAVRRQCSGAFSLYCLSMYTSFRHFNAQPHRSHIKPRRGNLVFPYISSQFHIPSHPQQESSPDNSAPQPAALARFSSASGSTLTQQLFDLISCVTHTFRRQSRYFPSLSPDICPFLHTLNCFPFF